MNGFKTTLTIASVICFFLLVASCDDSGGGAATTGTANSHATGPTQGTQLLRWNEYDDDFVFPAPRAWNNSLSGTVADFKPHHNGYDLFLAQGATTSATIEGKFHYGDIRKDLEGEDIGLYYRKADAGTQWQYVTDGQTNNDGRVYFNYPGGMGSAGTYFVRMVVYGDLTKADMLVRVIDQVTPCAVFDIDGTLTINDEQVISQYLGDFLDLNNVPTMYDNANKVAAQLAKQGYDIVYMTARPYWLSDASRVWLQRKGFPLGQVYTYSGAGIASGTTASDYKRDKLNDMTAAGADFNLAFGNADTDITAYAQAGINVNDTYIIGPNGGNGGTIALGKYSDLYGNLVQAPVEPYRVMMLVIDGLRPDALNYYVDNMAGTNSALKRLFGTRGHFDQSLTVAPSVTFANHAAMMTGCNPNHNGLTGNMFFDRQGEFVRSFTGETWTVTQVADVYNNDGLANRALKCQTLYEQMSASGRYGVSVGHMYYKGAEYIYPSLTDLATYLTDARTYDGIMVDKALNRLNGQDTPDLLTVYLPGLDHEVHGTGNVGGVTLSPMGAGNSQLDYLEQVIDPQLARLEAQYQSLGLMGNTVWVVTSDHGMRDMYDDDAHNFELDPTGFDNEMEDVLEDTHYNDCYDKPGETAFDCFAGLNGGLAHIMLKNMGTNSWQDAPRWNDDVIPVLGSIGRHRASGEFFQLNQDGIEDVLVRQGFGQAYQVVRPTRVRVHFDSAYIVDDNDTIGAGEVWFDLKINGHVFSRLGEFSVNDGDTVPLNMQFEADVYPGMDLNVEAYGEDDDGLYWDSMGTALAGFSTAAGLPTTPQTVTSSSGDFKLTYHVETLTTSTSGYTPFSTWGNLCPLTVLNVNYANAIERLNALNDADRSVDIILLPKWRDGFAFGGGNKANHGSLYPEDSKHSFFLGGQALAMGGSLGGHSITDVSPTVAHILGIQMRNVDGYSRATQAILPQPPQ
ncbi:MAG: alkaline phosphatase family protein [Planctomycetes bacterium]|nr:alkaline phosphatase family protein [Planctomycetota bacterium]